MKKMSLIVAAFMMATVSYVSAQTEEQKASEERVEQLKKAEYPKESGVKEIDDLARSCKSISESTVGIAIVTKVFNGEGAADVDLEKVRKMPETLKTTTSELGDVAKMLPKAAEAFKELKNPMKMKAAKKSMDYINEVSKLTGAELPYQTQLVNNIISGK